MNAHCTRTLAFALTATAALAASGCNTKNAPPPASFPPKTTIKMAQSARCSGGACKCRPLTDDGVQKESNIAPGTKRYELRLASTTSAVWVEVAGKGVYYKEPNSVRTHCFYVDLAPGSHKLTLQGESRDVQVGLQTGLTIYEYGPKEGPHWYRSLKFECGNLMKCTRDDIRDWRRKQRKLPRGVLDPCGSTMIRRVSYGGTRSDRKLDEYKDITLRLTMKVYKFETYRPPGHPKCKAPINNR